jgi:hypothetical protein
VRVDYPDDAWLYPPDPPRCSAEQEHIARHALDRPVLVHHADQGVVRLGKHPVVAELRDRTAGGECREPGAAPAAQLPAHLIPVQIGSPAAAASPDTFRHQLGGILEVRG